MNREPRRPRYWAWAPAAAETWTLTSIEIDTRAWMSATAATVAASWVPTHSPRSPS